MGTSDKKNASVQESFALKAGTLRFAQSDAFRMCLVRIKSYCARSDFIYKGEC